MQRRRHGMFTASIVALVLTGCAGSAPQPAMSRPAPSQAAPAPRAVEVTPVRPVVTKAKPVTNQPSAAPQAAPAPTQQRPMPSALRGVAAPEWHVGDQWAFRWESSQGQGEYVWTVDRIEAVDGIDHYVIKTGPREIFFRVRDLATSLEINDTVVQVRHEPPRLSFSWPLTPGTIWHQTLTQETESQRAQRTIAWEVEGEERVRVEAGSFDTLKIVARHEFYKSGAVMYEMWYAPKVKQWVRLQEHFPAGIRYRELTEYALN
jgi:hypothetical protein